MDHPGPGAVNRDRDLLWDSVLTKRPRGSPRGLLRSVRGSSACPASAKRPGHAVRIRLDMALKLWNIQHAPEVVAPSSEPNGRNAMAGPASDRKSTRLNSS